MNITWDGTTRYFAALIRRDTDTTAGEWTLHLLDENGDITNDLFRWAPSPLPVPLVARYDALALVGFAVLRGGVEHWRWRELADEDGTNSFMGVTELRPLRPEEVAPASAPAHLTMRP